MSNNKFIKRIVVTEGDLFTLWSNVSEVRKKEQKAAFKAEFKQLLNDAELVSMKIIKKGGNHDK